MARAYRCDLCNKFTDCVQNVSGFDFKIGEQHDEFTGTRAKMKEVKEVCLDVTKKVLNTVKELYKNATTEQ